ncbi:unnamed protein product [Prunus armeniaca]|uniref:NB-ARC domain-containing protein n=1 Tax=Prunus armeniaca TaxID=36596 RepID=A0A6J5Y2I0_PRUAR|nr:unnamed protein product [Prunus armeniaca]
MAYPALQKVAEIWGVEDNLDSLRDALMRTQVILQDAEEQQLTNKPVRLWLSNLKSAASDAEDILDFFIASEAVFRFKNPATYFSFPITTASVAEKIKKELHRLEKTINEGLSTFNFRVPCTEEDWLLRRRLKFFTNKRETGSCVVDSKIYGRDDEKEKLVKLLLSKGTSQDGYATCIPVIGIGGIGKTTLTQLAYNDERVVKHFDCRIWIFVSEDFDVKKIMKIAIECATEDECKLLEIELLQSRLSKLLQKKRYLIVLDDVWTEDQDVPCLQGVLMAAKSLSQPADDDCWSLFKHRAFGRREEEKYPNLTRIGKEIIKKIGGVPLAAKKASFQKKEGKRPEDIGEEYFSELLWISFLQEVRLHDGGEIIGYKMNDIIHDLAQYVAGKEYVVLNRVRHKIGHQQRFATHLLFIDMVQELHVMFSYLDQCTRY